MERSHRGARSAIEIAWISLALLLVLSSFAGKAADDVEYQVKAAYVYKIAGYIEWPALAFTSPEQPFKIGVVAAAPLIDELRRLLADRRIGGRVALIFEVREIIDAAGCQVLFIGRDASAALPSWISAVAGQAVLIVSESSGALDAGGMVNFVVVDRRIRFEIAQPPVERAGLKLSALLLKAALAVRQGKPVRQEQR